MDQVSPLPNGPRRGHAALGKFDVLEQLEARHQDFEYDAQGGQPVDLAKFNALEKYLAASKIDQFHKKGEFFTS